MSKFNVGDRVIVNATDAAVHEGRERMVSGMIDQVITEAHQTRYRVQWITNATLHREKFLETDLELVG